jgi:hypothetical protein
MRSARHLIGENRERRAAWRREHPEVFFYERWAGWPREDCCVAPSKAPKQNTFAESFIGRLRDELLLSGAPAQFGCSLHRDQASAGPNYPTAADFTAIWWSFKRRG